MELNFGNLFFYFPNWIVLCCSLFLAFVITYIVIPSIVRVSKEKGLFDEPGPRKFHSSAIPTLGGAAVFLGFILPTVIFGNQGNEHELKYIIVSLLILFFVGIKDDILVISARKKLISEIFAIGIVIFLGDIRISNFYGFMGINEIPYFVSALFTLFVFVVIINGFNLIDGIDGLASGVGIITVSTFVVYFILIKDFSYAAFCFSAIGALMAFFRFNVFSKINKIFLGDTGSLIIGLIISIFSVKFLESNLVNSVGNIGESAPAIAFGVLIVPMIDTLRVFFIRILAGKSPFKPDRSHIHHRLIDLGYSHLKSTLIILGFNLIIIALSWAFSHLGNMKLLLIIIPVSIVLTSIPSAILRYRDRLYFAKFGLLGEESWIMPETVSNLSRFSVGRKKSYDSLQKSIELSNHGDMEPISTDTLKKYYDTESSIIPDNSELFLD